MKIGYAITTIRKQRGLRQYELAAAVGVTPTYLSQIEKDQKDPSVGLLKLIAEKLETPLVFLVTLGLEGSDIKTEKLESFRVIEPILKGLVSQFCN